MNSMYQNMVNSNPMLNQFNNYMAKNPNQTPFQNNQLINQNVHVLNNLNNYIHQKKITSISEQQHINIPVQNNHKKGNNCGKNIIEEMLKPQKIKKDENKDILPNFKIREEQDNKKFNQQFKMTNAPYKNIIRDKIINKKVEDIKLSDLLVHQVTEKDRDKNVFEKEVEMKKKEKKEINQELEIEFHIDNYAKHKAKFEYKESFIRNLAYEANGFDENKQDYIEFYRKHQKEAEEGKQWCDEILRNIVDTGLIKPEELPSNVDDIESQEIDNNSKSEVITI
uniref:Uncharacterized protein n=1 Tax=viral metagenome TaxID=1070528 RepID=A0A6C0LSP0_9ZZZZ